jgi:hypothetical protein
MRTPEDTTSDLLCQLNAMNVSNDVFLRLPLLTSGGVLGKADGTRHCYVGPFFAELTKDDATWTFDLTVPAKFSRGVMMGLDSCA